MSPELTLEPIVRIRFDLAVVRVRWRCTCTPTLYVYADVVRVRRCCIVVSGGYVVFLSVPSRKKNTRMVSDGLFLEVFGF